WPVTYAAPLYVFVAVTRLGPLGGVTATAALAVTHVAMALYRADVLGMGDFDVARPIVGIRIYGLAALLTIAVEREPRRLGRRREMQVDGHEPLLRAHDELGQGVVVTDDGRPIYVSEGFLDLPGMTRADAMGLSDIASLLLADGDRGLREGVS